MLEYDPFATHYSKLKQLQFDPSLWTDEDSPSPETMAWAELILDRLEDLNLPPTKIVASAEGGVALCFLAGEKYADIELLNSGLILGVTSEKRSRPSAWEVEPSSRGLSEATARIRGFLQQP